MAGVTIGSYYDIYQDQYTLDNLTISLTATVPTPVIYTDNSQPPALEAPTVTVVSSVPTPTISAGATITPAAVAAPAAAPAVAAVTTYPLLTIEARESGFFYRIVEDAVPRLVLTLAGGRGGRSGLFASEGWEQVSSRFLFDGDNDGHTAAMAAVAAAWAADKGESAATLTASINEALNDAGYRDNKGELL